MHLPSLSVAGLLAAAAVVASGQSPTPALPVPEPAWKTRQPVEWSDRDAKEILLKSPWATTVRPALLRQQSEAERREGGNMGKVHGIGADGLEGADEGKMKLSDVGGLFGGQNKVYSSIRVPLLLLRWESALPVRTAELKAHFIEPPTLEGEGYQLAIYGVPSGALNGDPQKLGEPLKQTALLKREGKRPVRPVRVEVFQRDEGLVVVYLFPPSAEITPKDENVEFECQMGRLYVSHSFPLAAMMYAGKLEL